MFQYQINYADGKIKNGLSMAQIEIEKEIKVGKDTLRKKLNRNNFKYDKNFLNIYVLQTKNIVTHQKNRLTKKKLKK